MKLDHQFLSQALSPDSFILKGGKKYALAEIESLFDVGKEYTLSIDTRLLEAGQIFLALEGEHVDGHDFLEEAVAQGAVACIVNKERRLSASCLLICVPDTMQALIMLAKAWRQQFNYPVVGVTGSVGKTTTKEMIYAVLQHAGIKSCASYKNQNTLVGVCLNILKMRHDHKAAIFELGISEKGEMLPKVALLRPTISVVTMVGHQHMDGLGSLSEIAQEKRKIFEYFKSDNVGVIYGDQSLLSDAYYTHPVVRFGFRTKNQIQARKVKLHFNNEGAVFCFTLKVYKEKAELCLKTNHKGYIHNALAASAVAHLLGVPFAKIIEGLQNFVGFDQRFEKRLLKGKQGVLISDCYNANPESMKEALLAIHEMKGDAKIAVLGDMLGLGEQELFWHRQIGRVLAKASSVKTIILVGERARVIAKTAPLLTQIDYASDWQEATKKLQKKLIQSDILVLVKASRGMALENLVDAVTE